MRWMILIAVVLVAGCQRYPLGMSEEQWLALSPQQQLEAQAEQARIDEQRRQARAEQARLLAERREAEAAAYEAALAERRQAGHFGDVVTVSISDGTMKFRGKRRPYRPVVFDLVRGEARPVRIERTSGSTGIDVIMRLSEDGRTFFFDAASDEAAVFVDDGWEAGRTYTVASLDNDNADPEGIAISIRYRRLKEPTRIILEASP